MLLLTAHAHATQEHAEQTAAAHAVWAALQQEHAGLAHARLAAEQFLQQQQQQLRQESIDFVYQQTRTRENAAQARIAEAIAFEAKAREQQALYQAQADEAAAFKVRNALAHADRYVSDQQERAERDRQHLVQQQRAELAQQHALMQHVAHLQRARDEERVQTQAVAFAREQFFQA